MTADVRPALYLREFGLANPYDVPALIGDDPTLEDCSWCNDVCPSFTVRAYVEAAGPENGAPQWPDLRVWIHPSDPTLREVPFDGPERFTVQCDDCSPCLFADAAAAVQELKRQAAAIIAQNQKGAVTNG